MGTLNERNAFHTPMYQSQIFSFSCQRKLAITMLFRHASRKKRWPEIGSCQQIEMDTQRKINVF